MLHSYFLAVCFVFPIFTLCTYLDGSVTEWLACWTQALKGPGSNCSRDVVG